MVSLNDSSHYCPQFYTLFTFLFMIAIEVVGQTQTVRTVADSRLCQRCPLAQKDTLPADLT